MITERISLSGDLLDKNILGQVLDLLNENQVQFRIRRFTIGEISSKPSLVEITLTAPDLPTMHKALAAVKEHGAGFSLEEVHLVEAEMDGVLPENFHSTTNFTTHILKDNQWVEVENIEMDCGIRAWQEGYRWRAETCA